MSDSNNGAPAPQRIAIFGAGAIGSSLGGRLAQAGRSVVLIARGPHLAAMQSDGLVLEGPQGREPVEVPATDDPASAGPQDIVVFAVKAHQLAAAVEAAQPLLGGNTTVITAINGLPWWYFQGIGGPHEGLTLASVDPGGRIAGALRPHNSLGCVVYCAAEIVQPGVVRHSPGRFVLGDPGGRLPDKLRTVSDLFTVPEIKAPIAEDIRQEMWMKLWGNAIINPISALTLAKVGPSVSAPEIAATVLALFEEVGRVFGKLGVEPGIPAEERIAGASRMTMHRTSTLQDLEAGRPLEIEALTGAVVELAHILDVEVPRLETVLSLIRLRAAMME